MGAKRRLAATGRTPNTLEVINRHNNHTGETWDNILAEREQEELIREANRRRRAAKEAA